jgi:hypothetical protein
MQVFYVNASNITIKGEPPRQPEEGKRASKDKQAKSGSSERISLDFSEVRTPFKIAAAALALLCVGWLTYPFVFAGPETLEQRSIRAAQSLLEHNEGRLRSFVSPASWEDVKRWSTEIGPKLDAYRNRWPGHDLNVSVLVINESQSSGRATVIAYYSPPPAVARTGSASGDILADSSGKLQPLEITLNWTLGSGNVWLINARETAAANQTLP